MFIELPKNVHKIIETLEQAGFEAYAVGGCVRDSVLGRIPNDWDITTSAKPEEIKKTFKRTFDTGIKHGTVSVLFGNDIYEVTTYRIDGEYEDSRHPKDVTFTSDLKEDLLRRDFTINAMAYNPEKGLVDMYGGMEDVEKKVIRCVGNPHERFSEDALRILRAVRFAAQLDYTIDKETQDAIKELAPTLSKISAERIQAELTKILLSDHPEYLRLAYELKITKVILPEFDDCMACEQHNPHHFLSVGEHTLMVMQNVKPDKNLRYAALFHDFGKVRTKTTDKLGIDHFKGHPLESEKIAREIFKRLKFDNDTTRKVCLLIKYHDWMIGASPKNIRRLINQIGEECFPEMFDLNKADLIAQSRTFKAKEKRELFERFEAAYKSVMDKKECVSLKTLKVNGSDVIRECGAEGSKVGAILKELLDIVLDDPSKNDREYLLNYLREKKKID